MKYAIGFIVALGLLIGSAVGITYSVERYQCGQVEQHSPQVDAVWHGWAGCYITEDGKTFPIDKWRNDE